MNKIVITITLFILSIATSFGQCAMCKATLETKVGEESYVGVGAGINAGVLYLMFIPYLILIGIALFFRFKKKQAQNNIA